MLTEKRFIQIAYPVIIFFSLLLAWNSVGQEPAKRVTLYLNRN
jgi:hypothetical protein